MIRIGVVNIDVSHPKAFSEYLLKGDRARYVAIYNDGFREDDEVEAFIKNRGLEKRCNSVEELADMVDIGFIQGCNWDKHLAYAQPFFDRNKPVFIDKPMVGNIAECYKIKQLVDEGAVILGSSSVRYAEEIINFLSIPENERGKIISIFGNSAIDEFNYGIHIVEAIGGLMGKGAESCRFAGRGTADGQTSETFVIQYENGASAVYNTYMGIWQPFEIVIITTKSTFHFQIDTTKLYKALLDRICDYMETSHSTLATINELLESVHIMLAGKISRGNNGEPILLSQIPLDDPGYDGAAFEKDYASKASKIYLG